MVTDVRSIKETAMIDKLRATRKLPHRSQGSNRMKFTMNVECTPEEARAFFGLPDVQPMQQRLMQEMEERLLANVRAMDPEVIARTWFPAGLQNFEQLQKMFWSQVQQSLSGVSGTARGGDSGHG